MYQFSLVFREFHVGLCKVWYEVHVFLERTINETTLIQLVKLQWVASGGYLIFDPGP